MVSRIETLLIALHMHFNKSPKHHMEFQELVELLDSKRKKILQNVRTRWINIYAKSLETCLVRIPHPFGEDVWDQYVKPTIPILR